MYCTLPKFTGMFDADFVIINKLGNVANSKDILRKDAKVSFVSRTKQVQDTKQYAERSQ